ncbi:MAG TPA: dihydroorotate dehydrogenase electron transfer subunit [Symbiobacteriaceae bacterium]|nr:dihydroorotate dehydrogenase electron transfer subunit [Symbiobacteriaceae bacterium]
MREALKASRRKVQWVDEPALVLAHEGDGEVFKLTLQAPQIAQMAAPGQFVMVKVGGVDPLLRRPFSLCEIRPEAGEITLIYRVVGRGTGILAEAPVGARLLTMGPLGYSFPDPAVGSGELLLVGGGLGIPPMVAAATAAVKAGRAVRAILGARSARYLAGAAELQALGVRVDLVTDDGTAGERGVVTGPLAAALERASVETGDTAGAGVSAEAEASAEVWACGPEGMLKAVGALAAQHGAPCFLSVERHMACGFGACIGCTVPKASGEGFFKACQDGPVFLAEEVTLGV